jgi:hypothetical protein
VPRAPGFCMLEAIRRQIMVKRKLAWRAKKYLCCELV